ncbi:hypothetical protein MRB53_038813 [Persea americana]|nr:hypothetical protein MRB53_038813 [Persea americana]
MAKLLKAGTSKDLLTTCIKTLVRLASHIESAVQAQSILDICGFLLVQPAQLVPNWTKTDLLKTITSLLNVSGVAAAQDLYNATSGLFSRFRDIESRAILSETYQLLSASDDEFQEAAKICLELNSVSSVRLDEPDHEKRDLAFAQIYERASTFTSKSWTPILHNCLYFIMDEDDTVNRASAAKALQLLITTSTQSEDRQNLVKTQLFPAVQRGMTARSEFVRAEYLQLLGMMASTYQDWDELSDMQSLTFDNDDEASFFTNILHIQQHRRLRALRRLGEESKVHSKNIVRIFMPLLEQFVFDATPGDSGRALADQATKADLQKTVLRLLGALVDGLDASVHDTVAESSAIDGDDVTGQLASRPEEINGRMILPSNRAKVVINDFLPPLLGFLHHKDESDVDRRVGVAVSATKLLRLLPEDDFVIRLAPMLTDVAHILRSRELEAREASRKTLSTILGLIGSSYLGFLLKELRGALSRGYQLHVLSYTVHHLLISAESSFENGDVDDCVPDLVAVALDDIFGVTGQEKEAEEYKTSMKEIKSSKSYDTFEILGRITSVTRLGQLILPIRALLQEKLDGSVVKKIDSILTRIRRGIDLNPASETQGILIFCHELVRQVYRQQALTAQDAGLQDWKLKKYVQKPKSSAALKNATTSYIFKLTAFALGLVRKVVLRHEELRTATNMAGFLPMIGDGLVSGEQEVKIEAARLLSAVLH